MIQSKVLVLALSILIAAPAAHPPACAEDSNSVTVTGYITAVHLPDEFDVKRAHVTITENTQFMLLGSPAAKPQIVRPDIGAGMYVRVTGMKDFKTNTVAALTIEVRDDTGQSISGAGVIDRVIATGAESVFRADGYNIRITSNTDVRYGNNRLD